MYHLRGMGLLPGTPRSVLPIADVVGVTGGRADVTLVRTGGVPDPGVRMGALQYVAPPDEAVPLQNGSDGTPPAGGQQITNSGGPLAGSAPLGINSAMPPLSPSACSATQTYIAPGGVFTKGSMAGQITPTGACEDNTSAAPAGDSFLSSIPWWGWLGGVGLAVFALRGQHGR